MITFTDDDARKMRALQTDLAAVLRQANDQHLEAAIAVFALARCARILLDCYPEATRRELLEGAIVPFLKGEPFLGPMVN